MVTRCCKPGLSSLDIDSEGVVSLHRRHGRAACDLNFPKETVLCSMDVGKDAGVDSRHSSRTKYHIEGADREKFESKSYGARIFQRGLIKQCSLRLWG